jgi:hypothetical protein
MKSERSRRSVRWTELPSSSMQRESDFTGARSDEMHPTKAGDQMGTLRVEHSSAPYYSPAALSVDFQFPQQTSAPGGSEPSCTSSDADHAYSNPRAPVPHKTNILYATGPDVLYETGPSRPESLASPYGFPPSKIPAIDARPLSQSHSNFTGATSASRSISPRRATTTTATSVSPTFFKRNSVLQESPTRCVSPLPGNSREGALSPSVRMSGFKVPLAGQLELRTVDEARQAVGTTEDRFAPSGSGYGAGNSPTAVPGPSGSSSIPFPREPMEILPIRRPPARAEMSGRDHQMREMERKRESTRIVQLAMASPGMPVSMESFSTDSVLETHQGVAPKPFATATHEGSHPPVSMRPDHLRKDSLAATTETHQTRFSTKSYPYAGLIALHAPTARPLSASSQAKSQMSFGQFSLSAETDYGNRIGALSKSASRAASFSSSQYLYGYPDASLDEDNARGRSLRSSRRSSLSAFSVDPTSSSGRQRNLSFGPSGRAGARASFGPTNKAEAAQRAAALIQLTSGVRRDR